jgi:predicted nucleic acid-binding protein
MGARQLKSAMFLLDSTVLIDYSRDRKAAVSWLERSVDQFAVSVVTLAEFRQGIRNTQEMALLEHWMHMFDVLPVTQDVALLAGQWGQQYRRAYQLEMSDLLIAATAQVQGLQLATHNLKHYPMFEDLKPPY